VDPLTHTLVGASLASTRLGKTTRLATVALVVGANLPDVDGLAYFVSADAAFGFRRGWTHGMLALALLPALFALALWLWGRRGAPKGERLSLPWLFGLSYLAIWTHPALDWLNTYGMRWWMPFDGTWYHGDSVYIADPWLWLVLGAGCLLGREPTRRTVTISAVLAGALLLMIWRRAPENLPLVGLVLALLMMALLLTPSTLRVSPTRAAALGLILAGLFIVVMVRTQRLTESHVRASLAAVGVPIEDLMVGPLPARPWTWEFVAQYDQRLRHGTVSWIEGGSVQLTDFDQPTAQSSALWPEILASDQQPGFLGWARFPWMVVDEVGGARRIEVMDARYTRRPGRGFGQTEFDLPAPN
jgi:inner membrane protein